MSDHYFPIYAPSDQELRLIILIRYIISPSTSKQDFITVKVWNTELKRNIRLPSILVPVHYKDHLCRFLWRHQVFMEVVRRSVAQEVHLVPHVSPIIQRYIMYMDGIAEGLLTTARNKHDDSTYRSVTFDMYLVVEHFVGRHEYDVADWTTFYQEKDTSDPVWSGKHYDFKVSKVPEKDWQKIADQAAHYLGFMNDINEQPTKHGKGKRKVQDNAASAGPSKKTRSKTGPSAATAGPSKHK